MRMKSLFNVFILFGFIVIQNSCETRETLAVVSTKFSIQDISPTTAISGGVITDDRGFTVTSRGVCWSTEADPTILDSLTINGSGAGLFTSNLINLKPNTSYYLRAYATTKIGTSYGNSIYFKTLSGIADLVTNDPDSIMATSFKISGQISQGGGADIIERGFCLALHVNPTITDTKISNGDGLGAFTSTIHNLNPASTYYVRAYATNRVGTTYGNEVSLTTQSGIINLSTTPISNVKAFSATLGGNITYDGGSKITSRGICWSTTPNPTTDNNTIMHGIGKGVFTGPISGLTHETTYYVRAFAINNLGIYYGNEVSFTTKDGIIKISTNPVSHVGVIHATSGGNITDDGGANLIAKGVCWSTSENPTINLNTKTNNGTSTGVFTSFITGLAESTTYYVRSYATNSIGTTYGNEMSFTTKVLSESQMMDIEGNVYNTITIGNQTWMVENLRTSKYRNGNTISTSNPASKNINSETSPKYQWAYEANENNVLTYGRLYTWYAATDSRNIAPIGWRVPTDADWTILENYLIANGYNYDGSTSGNKIAKSISAKSLWKTNTSTGSIGFDLSKNNSSGFSAVPGGYRFGGGAFGGLGSYGSWWSITEGSSDNAWSRSLDSEYINLNRASSSKTYGFSVRCIKE